MLHCARLLPVALALVACGLGGSNDAEPSPAEALAAEGRKLLAKGDEPEGAAKLEEAAKLAPEDATIALDACKAWVAADRPPDAIKACRNAAKLAPSEAQAHYLVGTNAHRLERRDEALASLRRACELAPGEAKAHHELAMVLVTGSPSPQELETAVAESKEALKLAPGELEYEMGLARTQIEARACEDATKTIVGIGDRADVGELRSLHYQRCGK